MYRNGKWDGQPDPNLWNPRASALFSRFGCDRCNFLDLVMENSILSGSVFGFAKVPITTPDDLKKNMEIFLQL
uniref:Uncharacterized protein n=1 Tax=Romanomermis culicivorax TaxID=13658 RepID=A0A915J4K2_ROMCU